MSQVEPGTRTVKTWDQIVDLLRTACKALHPPIEVQSIRPILGNKERQSPDPSPETVKIMDEAITAEMLALAEDIKKDPLRYAEMIHKDESKTVVGVELLHAEPKPRQPRSDKGIPKGPKGQSALPQSDSKGHTLDLSSKKAKSEIKPPPGFGGGPTPSKDCT